METGRGYVLTSSENEAWSSAVQRLEFVMLSLLESARLPEDRKDRQASILSDAVFRIRAASWSEGNCPKPCKQHFSEISDGLNALSHALQTMGHHPQGWEAIIKSATDVLSKSKATLAKVVEEMSPVAPFEDIMVKPESTSEFPITNATPRIPTGRTASNRRPLAPLSAPVAGPSGNYFPQTTGSPDKMPIPVSAPGATAFVPRNNTITATSTLNLPPMRLRPDDLDHAPYPIPMGTARRSSSPPSHPSPTERRTEHPQPLQPQFYRAPNMQSAAETRKFPSLMPVTTDQHLRRPPHITTNPCSNLYGSSDTAGSSISNHPTLSDKYSPNSLSQPQRHPPDDRCQCTSRNPPTRSAQQSLAAEPPPNLYRETGMYSANAHPSSINKTISSHSSSSPADYRSTAGPHARMNYASSDSDSGAFSHPLQVPQRGHPSFTSSPPAPSPIPTTASHTTASASLSSARRDFRSFSPGGSFGGRRTGYILQVDSPSSAGAYSLASVKASASDERHSQPLSPKTKPRPRGSNRHSVIGVQSPSRISGESDAAGQQTPPEFYQSSFRVHPRSPTALKHPSPPYQSTNHYPHKYPPSPPRRPVDLDTITDDPPGSINRDPSPRRNAGKSPAGEEGDGDSIMRDAYDSRVTTPSGMGASTMDTAPSIHSISLPSPRTALTSTNPCDQIRNIPPQTYTLHYPGPSSFPTAHPNAYISMPAGVPGLPPNSAHPSEPIGSLHPHLISLQPSQFTFNPSLTVAPRALNGPFDPRSLFPPQYSPHYAMPSTDPLPTNPSRPRPTVSRAAASMSPLVLDSPTGRDAATSSGNILPRRRRATDDNVIVASKQRARRLERSRSRTLVQGWSQFSGVQLRQALPMYPVTTVSHTPGLMRPPVPPQEDADQQIAFLALFLPKPMQKVVYRYLISLDPREKNEASRMTLNYAIQFLTSGNVEPNNDNIMSYTDAMIHWRESCKCDGYREALDTARNMLTKRQPGRTDWV